MKSQTETAASALRVWCDQCGIRIAPQEERTAVKGKTYHPRCHVINHIESSRSKAKSTVTETS